MTCPSCKSSRKKTKQFSSYFRFPTSHTTVRAVPHTAVSILDTIRDTHGTSTMLSSHIHIKVCTPPLRDNSWRLPSPCIHSDSDLSLWGQPLTWYNVFLHSFLHEVCFYYYRLIVRFSPSCNVIEYCTTMASADFLRQALLHDFRKK